MKKFTRIMSLVLALVMIMSMAACSTKTPVPTEDNNPVITDPVDTEPNATESVATVPVENQIDITIDNPVVFFSMTLGENYDNILSMTVYPNDDGTVYVEYVGAEKKVGNLDTNIMNDITVELAKTELVALNAQDVYGEGEANGSMYIELADGTPITVNYTGDVPEMFVNGYEAMALRFEELTASVPVYIPQPQIVGEIVDLELMASNMHILNASQMPNLDAIAVSTLDIEDEFFGNTAGLTSADGIISATSAAPMMMSQAYSLVIVRLEDANTAENVAKDFENNIDWRKWVCVAPSNALIATKDDMVLCLQAADEAYTMTVAGIETNGWIRVNELTNPDLG